MNKREKIKALLEKAKEYNEELYNLVGDLIPGRDAKEIRRQIFINNRMHEQTIALLEKKQKPLEDFGIEPADFGIRTDVEETFHSAREVFKTYLPNDTTKGCADCNFTGWLSHNELCPKCRPRAKDKQVCKHCNNGWLIEKEPGIIAKALIPCPHCEEGKRKKEECQKPEQGEYGSSITPNLTNNDVMGLFPPPTLNTSEKFWMK